LARVRELERRLLSGAVEPAPEELTYDALFGGAVHFWQPARGYRVNIDAILLAAFTPARARGESLDLGSGVGAVTLALAYLRGVVRGTLIECEPALAALAERNLAQTGIDGRVLAHDLDSHGLPDFLRGTAELVVCNPPFYEPREVRAAAYAVTRRARSGPLDPFLSAAAQALTGKRASACFAYPARALEHLLGRAREHGLVAKRLRFVHADRTQNARLCLVELRRARPGGLIVEAPLYEWNALNVRSPELEALTGAAPSVPLQALR
jgi:tRNA1(Val) A37 N6-methylase TrmN6